MPCTCSLDGFAGASIDPDCVYHGNSTAPVPHVCNCIGCCPICGHCRTDPKHTPSRCAETAKITAKLRALWR